MIQTIALAALGAVSTLDAGAHADETWYDDFDAAVRAAEEQGKDLLVDFTGSDWCGWCIKLHDEVFQHDEWVATAQKDYVLVALDFPRSDEAKAKVPNPKRNDELQAKYGVRGFPTILLMTPEGDVFGRTGYQPGGPTAYLEHMTELRAGRPMLMEIKGAAAAFETAADDAARWAAWDTAVVAAEKAPKGAPFIAQVEPVLRWGIEADASNEAGKKARSVSTLLGAGLADDGLIDMASELDPKNEAGMLDLVAEYRFSSVRDEAGARAAVETLNKVDALGFKDNALAFRLHYQAAVWAAGPLADPELKAKHAKRAKEIGTDDAEMLKALDELIG
ncbi:MAG: thioredoxin family protein [Planctomycetota bacterium]